MHTSGAQKHKSCIKTFGCLWKDFCLTESFLEENSENMIRNNRLQKVSKAVEPLTGEHIVKCFNYLVLKLLAKELLTTEML